VDGSVTVFTENHEVVHEFLPASGVCAVMNVEPPIASAGLAGAARSS
jgi:hypothetical protein